MKKRRNENLEKSFGFMRIDVSGTRYYEGIKELSTGDELCFQREPENRHDKNAVRVVTAGGVTVGHLPRVHASYLAPLMDSESIALAGRARKVNSLEQYLQAEIEASVLPEGEKRFRKVSCPDTADDLVKNLAIEALSNLPDISVAEAKRLRNKMLKMASGGALPEVYLIVNLLEGKAVMMERKRAKEEAKKVSDILSSIRVGVPISHKGLTIFPLTFDQAPGAEYITLEEALASGCVEITEVSQEGRVPELMFRNGGDHKILLLDGEELVGARQNRIINISMLIQQINNIKIPVSCVEQGRWSYRSEAFSSGAHSSASVRFRNKSAVLDNLKTSNTFSGDQGRVWEEVNSLLCDIGAESETGAMNDGYKKLEERLNDYEAGLKLPDDARGYVACVGNRIVGGDVFDRPETMRQKWSKLVRSMAIEAERSEAHERGLIDERSVLKFLADASKSVTGKFQSPGIGATFNIEGPVVGSALLADSALVHASFFQAPDMN